MSGAMRELGFDEASVDFSIDPEMYTKLDIKKAKIGEENEFDEQKIYNFQLAKDVTKLREKRGPFQERNHKFLELRGRDPFYQSIALKQGAGSRGDFRSLLPDTTDASWRATSQPFGRIAREKYMHWLANLPKGPSPEEILDKLQRARDKELWDQVLAGKTEPTKKELRAIDDARIAAMKVELQHADELPRQREERIRQERIDGNHFADMRHLPTRQEFADSMGGWHKGVHYPYDWGKGFPFVKVEILTGSCLQTDAEGRGTVLRSREHSSKAFIKSGTGQSGAAENAYQCYIAGENMGKVDKYLKLRKKVLTRERKAAEVDMAIKERQRRRVGRVSRHDIRMDVIDAKWQKIQQDGGRIKRVGKDGNVEEHSDSDSDSDSDTQEETGEQEQTGKKGQGPTGRGQTLGVVGRELGGCRTSVSEGGQLREGGQTGLLAGENESFRDRSAVSGQNGSNSIGQGGGRGENVEGQGGRWRERGVLGAQARGIGAVARGGSVAVAAVNAYRWMLGGGGGSVAPAGDEMGAPAMEAAMGPRARGEVLAEDIAPLGLGVEKAGVGVEGAGAVGVERAGVGSEMSGPAAAEMSGGTVAAGVPVVSPKSTKIFSAAALQRDRSSLEVLLQEVGNTADFLRPSNVASIIAKKYRKYKRTRGASVGVVGLLGQGLGLGGGGQGGGLTASEQVKTDTLAQLEVMAIQVKSQKYHNSMVNLAEGDIPTKEYMAQSKRTSRELEEGIRRLSALSSVGAVASERKLNKLRLRAKNHQKAVQERVLREDRAKERVGVIAEYIETSRQTVEERNEISAYDRVLIRIRETLHTLSQVKAPEGLKSNGVVRYILPPYEESHNGDFIQSLVDARAKQQESSRRRKVLLRAGVYMITGDLALLEEETSLVGGLDELVLAARAGNFIGCVDILFHATDPVSPNKVNEDGETPTYAALMMILRREVLDTEADLMSLSTQQRVWHALFVRHPKPQLDLVLRALLYAGGDVDFRRMEPGDDGYAVMHTACELDSTEMIEWLLKKGTPLNLRTTLGRKTPLMMALQYGSQEAVVLLLHYGAALHLDLVDAEGNTALHFAAIYSSTDCAMILLICGANSLSIRNKAGRLPGEEARARGRTEMAITILTYKSDNVDHLCRLQNLQTSQAHLQSDHRCRPQSAPAHGRSSDPLSDRGLSDDAIHPPRLVADAPISPSLLEGQMQEGQGQQTQARSRPQSASSMQGHGMGQGIGQGQGAKEEKKQLSRRMSSLIAERDPWNMGPVSKPLPRNMMKMSFYRKQVSSGTGLGAGAGAGFGGGAGSGTRRLNARAGARSDKSSSSNNSAGLLEKLA